MSSKKNKVLLNSAISFMQKNDPMSAIGYLNKILKKDPKDIAARTNLGLCKYTIGSFKESAQIFHDLHLLLPENPDINKWAGLSYSNIDHYDLAHDFLIRALKIRSKDVEILISLASILIKKNRETDAIYYATEALSLNPNNPATYNALGVCLMEINRFNDALICFDTAINLDSKNYQANINKANLLDRIEKYDDAISAYKDCLSISSSTEQEIEIKYKMSLPLLATGNLTEGWPCFEYGLKYPDTSSRNPKRSFNVSQWSGENIKDKTILVWREQGLGDEIDHFVLLPRLLEISNKVIIESDTRLISILQRSFPNCIVRPQTYESITKASTITDYDYHLPSGSLALHFLNREEHFSKVKPYLRPDPLLVEDFKNRLSKIGDHKYIGICWRSGFNSTSRNMFYTPISQWEPILKNQKLKFVNLQYGDCKVELENVRDNFGVEIINFEDIDLKNDLESVCALIAALDCVVSAGTAVACLSSAVGTKTKIYVSRNWALLGQNFRPWSPNSDLYLTNFENNFDYSQVISQIAIDLQNEFA